MNETQKTLTARRTVHDYIDAPIPEGALERALTCALRAPNHKLTNPWRFTKLGPEARGLVTELGVSIKRDKNPEAWTETKETRLRSKLGNPAHILVISQVRCDDDFRSKEDYAAVSCAIQNMSLSLWSEGVGSKWSTGGVTRHERAYTIAGIDAEAEEIVGFLFVGMAAVVPDPLRDPLDEVLRSTP